jgi:O-antigen ligase
MVIFVAAFTVLTALFAITARRPADMGFSLNFIGVLLAPVVYLMAREKPADDARDLLVFCLAGAGAAALMAVVGIAVLSEARATGLFGGPNLFPRLAIPLGFVAMGGALLLPGRSRMIFYLGPIFALTAGLLSGSRGAVLALAPLALLAIAALAIRRETRRDLIVFGGLAIVAIAGILLFSPGVTTRMLTAITGIGDVFGGTASADVATYERQILLAAGWSSFLSSPWVGYGWANLSYAAAAADPAHLGQLAGRVFMFHNDALDFAVAAGLFGVAAYLAILAAPIVGAIVPPRDGLRTVRLYGALVLSISFFVFGLTDMTLGYDVTTTLYAFLTALLLGVRTPVRS